MDFTQVEVDYFVSEYHQQMKDSYDGYIQACAFRGFKPMSFNEFVVICMHVTVQYPSLKERAEFYLDVEIQKGNIQQEDDFPPTMVYELEMAEKGAVLLMICFVDGGISFGVIDVPPEDLKVLKERNALR